VTTLIFELTKPKIKAEHTLTFKLKQQVEEEPRPLEMMTRAAVEKVLIRVYCVLDWRGCLSSHLTVKDIVVPDVEKTQRVRHSMNLVKGGGRLGVDIGKDSWKVCAL